MTQTAPGTLEALSAPELLEWAIGSFGREFAISTGFQAEGMVLVDMAARISKDVRIITLDTGRLPEETYQMMDAVWERYRIRVETVQPESLEVEAMVNRHGPNLFYNDLALRRLCCEVRKVRPLERKMRELRAWASGLRRGQSESRSAISKVEDQAGAIKLNPLADWSGDDVEKYTRLHDVPRHPLYSRGYTSIGCAPCTRAVVSGENGRAGRWWWEITGNKECGIHFTSEGKVERTVDVLLRELLPNA